MIYVIQHALVIIVLAWLVLNNWECFSVPLLVSCFVSIKHKIVVFFFFLFHMGWLGTCIHHVMTTKASHFKPLWSFSFWHVISLYDFINSVLSLCMIMVIIALLVGRSKSFASLHLYWVWALLVHPTPKSQNMPFVSTIPTYMWYLTATPK